MLPPFIFQIFEQYNIMAETFFAHFVNFPLVLCHPHTFDPEVKYVLTLIMGKFVRVEK